MKNLLIFPVIVFFVSTVYGADSHDRHQTIYAPFSIEGCDETVVGELVVHVLEDTDVKKDGSVFYRYHFNVHGTGIGQESGVDYVYNHVWNVNGHYDRLPFIHSFVRTMRLIGKGQASNLYTACFYKIVINANGETTVLIDKLGQSECK